MAYAYQPGSTDDAWGKMMHEAGQDQLRRRAVLVGSVFVVSRYQCTSKALF